MLCNFYPFFDRFGNTLLIYRKAHDKSAVFLYKREHRRHDLILTVDGIDHRLSVVSAKRRLHRNGIRRIDLKRNVGYRLETLYGLCKERRFVDVGNADINVKYMNLLISLAKPLV